MSFFCGPIQFCPHPISNERGRQKNTNKHRSWRLSPWTVRESNETYLEMVKHHVQWYVCNVAISSSMGFSVLIYIEESLNICTKSTAGPPYIQPTRRDIFRKSACARK